MEITDLLFSITEMVGTISFAVSGAMTAIHRRLDAFGVVALGMVTAFGGGALRDLLIGFVPPRCFDNYRLLAAAFGASLGLFVLAYLLRERYQRNEVIIDNINNIIDAVGLSAFTVSGIQAAIGAGAFDNPYFCIFLGMLTGVGGGILRDVMSCETPLVFTKRVYAVASLLGGSLYYLLLYVGAVGSVAVFVSMAVVIAVRVCATVFRWSLPKIQVHSDVEKVTKKLK